MKKVVLLAALMTFAGGLSAQAQEAKIAVLDAQGVVNSTDAAKQAVEILREKTAEAQKKINEMQAPLLKRRQELEQKRSVLSQEKFLEEESKLRKDMNTFRAEAQSMQEGLDRENLKLRRKITEEVRKVVDKVAEERGYSAVLPKKMMLYVDEAIDISADVLKRVNANMESITDGSNS